MRVAYVVPMSEGAVPQYTAGLANAVANAVEVVVLKPQDSSDKYFSSKVKIYNVFDPIYYKRGNELSALSVNNLKAILSYRHLRTLYDLKPDVVHYTFTHPQLLLFSSICKIHNHFPLVCTYHNVYKSASSIRGYNSFMMSLMEQAIKLLNTRVKPEWAIVHSEINKETLMNNSSCYKGVSVVPHGTIDVFSREQSNRSEVGGVANQILFFGYIVRNKGIGYLIDAMAEVRKVVKDANLFIAGEGDLSPYSKCIDDNPWITAYNQYISDELAGQLFQESKAVVLPYTEHAGHSGVLSVALAFGKPIVITDVGDFANIIDHGVNGLVVPPKDSVALSEAIITLLKNQGMQETLSKEAKRLGESLSWDNIARKHLATYEKAVQSFLARKRHVNLSLCD